MQRTDRWLGIGLAVLAAAILWSARGFPAVPGQKLGAGFLPTLIGLGFRLCGVVLVLRSLRGQSRERGDDAPVIEEHFGSSAVIVGAIVAYIVLAERLGFLIVVPVCLVAVFRALRVGWRPSLGWAIGGTLVVHLAFYKLLRVPLPWGVFRPFY